MIFLKSPTKPDLRLSLYVAESCCETPVSVALLLEEISLRLGIKNGLGFGIHSSPAEAILSQGQAGFAVLSHVLHFFDTCCHLLLLEFLTGLPNLCNESQIMV